MRQPRDLAEQFAVALGRVTCCILIALGQRRAGETIGQRRLADALGPDQQPSMMHAAAMERLVELADGRVVPE